MDLAIVEEKEKSVVVIENCENGFFGSLNCTLQGSGVIYDVETRTVNDEIIYDYYILTNAHVAYGGQAYKIHYEGYELLDHASLMGVYTEGTDLAILKLTTELKLIVLEDVQLDTREAVNIDEGQTGFSIGSPNYFENRQENFNVVKEGTIIGLNVPVKLEKEPGEEDDLNLCDETCYAFQTDAALGPGSSGGAMFDTAGNLIGIHFAGNEDNTISSEIPLSKVFEAIDAILGQ